MSKRIQVQFLASRLGDAHPPVTPAPRDPSLSSGLTGACTLMCKYPSTHTNNVSHHKVSKASRVSNSRGRVRKSSMQWDGLLEGGNWCERRSTSITNFRWGLPHGVLADWKQLWLGSRQQRSECSWGLFSLSFYFSDKCQLKKKPKKQKQVIFTVFSHTELFLPKGPWV